MTARVLIVDDDEAIRLVARLGLELEGYRVDEAIDGHAALARLADDTFDLILLDMRMPGLSGADFVRVYRAGGGNTPIVAFTAAVDAMVQAAEAEADAMLAKPFEIGALLDVVATTIGEAQDSRSR